MKFIKSPNDLPMTFDLAMAATITGYSVTRLRQLSQVGRFPAYKFGRNWLVDKDDFIEWKDVLKGGSKTNE